MQKYHFFKRKSFEGLDKYEKRLNDFVEAGWKVISMASDSGEMIILLERVKNEF